MPLMAVVPAAEMYVDANVKEMQLTTTAPPGSLGRDGPDAPLTGWFAARFGSVKVFVVSMVLSGVFSIVCGLSNAIGMLVVMRVFQGLSGGPLMPLSQTLMLRIFPKDKAGAAIGIWSMTTLVAPVVGLVLLIVWVAALQLVLDEGKNLDWLASNQIITLSVVGFVAFLIWELHENNRWWTCVCSATGASTPAC